MNGIQTGTECAPLPAPCRSEAVEKVSAIKTERGLALADITRLLCEYVFRLHMPPSARAELVSQMVQPPPLPSLIPLPSLL
jgi:hypothetical protein